MSSGTILRLPATEAAKAVADGAITSEQLVKACLERIEAREEAVLAWEHLDPEYALEQARRADAWRATGQGCGPLHGVPVGIKDIFDTADMPTQNGAPAHAGRQPSSDCAAVRALRSAGAVILGKTVTTELAVSHPGKTRNPVNGEYTPGGSSSGSAAAVADDMVPLALGTQTGGSVIRPASYCGVYGFKPTFGLISRTGVLNQSESLDTIGAFARSIEDLALVTDCLTAYDPADRASWPRSRPRLSEFAVQDVPLTPTFAFVKSPAWDLAGAQTAEAFSELAETLGEQCDEVELPSVFDASLDWHRTVQFADIARNYGPMVDKSPDAFSDALKKRVEEGRKILAADYMVARNFQDVLNGGIDEIFERYDAIITPPATGPAPKGLESTGDPAFCALWTYLGVPAVTLPLLEVDGLPLGVQLIGQRRDDGRLLRNARWLVEHLSENIA